MSGNVSAPLEKAPSPVSDRQRIGSLDIIRGAAVLGILLMNIPIFGLILQDQEYWDALMTKASGPNFWTDQVITVLFEGKMRALFCMLFGAGLMLFIQQKKARSGKSPWKLFYFRMFWLALFGLMHAHLILWVGDILYFYGIFGMVVFLLRNLKPGWKAMGVPIVAIIGIVMSQMYYADTRQKYLDHLEYEQVASAGGAITDELLEAEAAWQKFREENLPNQEELAEKTAKMRGSYSQVASVVRPDAFKFETKYLPFLLGDNVALMLLGMALLQWGFFAGKWSNKHYRITMLLGFGLGLPMVIFASWHNVTYTPTLEMSFAHVKNHAYEWSSTIYQFQRMFLALAHAAMLMLIIKSGFLKWLMRSLRAVGQTAFTNYIMQSVICSLFFFGYGLGYYGKLELYQLYFVVLAIWTLEMIVSPIWLKYFSFGPLEWVWRCLTYRKVMPFRR